MSTMKELNKIMGCCDELVWLQKISIHTPQMLIGNSEGVGVSQAKILKGKYYAKLEFLERWGVGGKEKYHI